MFWADREVGSVGGGGGGTVNFCPTCGGGGGWGNILGILPMENFGGGGDRNLVGRAPLLGMELMQTPDSSAMALPDWVVFSSSCGTTPRPFKIWKLRGS